MKPTGGLVYATGMNEVAIPISMTAGRKSRPDQLAGTASENLAELACRICYDSLGAKVSRSGADLHKHIQTAPNLSVYEHVALTVHIEEYTPSWLWYLVNRPGLRLEDRGSAVDVTLNLRTLLEWVKYSPQGWTGKGGPAKNLESVDYNRALFNVFYVAFHSIFPNYLASPIFLETAVQDWADITYPINWQIKTEDLSDDQVFISMWLYGSRGFTHEQVRHRFAISQRSTRFCDELPRNWPLHVVEENYCEGEYVYHPFLMQWLDDADVEGGVRMSMSKDLHDVCEADRLLYANILTELTKYAAGKGMDQLSARKQARGAARGVLANALASEMIFTTNIRGWRNILAQRASALADAEIRLVYGDVYDGLRACPYGDRFAGYEQLDSPDGLGRILIPLIKG